MKRYTPKDIESKWQKYWAEQKTYQVSADSSKEKIYATPMLPYPSGSAMHTGHVRNYAIADVVARYYRQKGKNTMTTMAWDSFGLPAENYAIKTGTPPAESTKKNIAYFKKQLQSLAMSYDWSREFDTSDPNYYKWTQWVFSLMHERGLAYKAEKEQWWCTIDKTVLADEQVVNGKSWRHDGPDDPYVIKKKISQWFFKITDYADEILEATDELNWPQKIKTMQKNWIGRSEGAAVDFALEGLGAEETTLSVFTTRPDTLFGVSFMVLAPEHPLVAQYSQYADNTTEIDDYVQHAKKKSEVDREKEKTKSGIKIEGLSAINPVNGEKISVWIADYVLMGYGTGAVMGVPAHDQRDHDFAKKYELPIVPVVATEFIDTVRPIIEGKPIEERTAVQTIVQHPDDDKYLILKLKGWEVDTYSLPIGGVESGEDLVQAAQREIEEETGYVDFKELEEVAAPYFATFHHDLKGVNRRAKITSFVTRLNSLKQIEIAQEEQDKHDLQWVSLDKLHEQLHGQGVQAVVGYYRDGGAATSGDGVLVNSGEYDGLATDEARTKIVDDLEKKKAGAHETTYKIRDWLISRQRYWGAPVPVVHVKDHGPVVVPTHQLPVQLPEVDDFTPNGETSVLASIEDWVHIWYNMQTGASVPFSQGKPEGDDWHEAHRDTDVMDGYVCSTWYLHRYADPANDTAAFDPDKANYWYPIDFYFGADHAVAHLLYVRFFQKVLADAGYVEDREPVKQLVYNGYINASDGRKMSKSLGNTVDPMDIIESGYGADSLRVFELFIAPYDQDTSWNDNGVPGSYKFLNRIWILTYEFLDSQSDDAAENANVLQIAHKLIAKVTSDLEKMSFNTAVAAMMSAVNELYLIKADEGFKSAASWRCTLESLLQCLAPFAPHITEELWHELGHEDSIHVDHWPEVDEKYLVEDTMTLAVQVNGKVRAEITVAADADKDAIITEALVQENVQTHLNGQEPKKTIYVPGRLVSVVVKI